MSTTVYCGIMSGLVVVLLISIWRYRNWTSCVSGLVVVGVSAVALALTKTDFSKPLA